MSSSSLTDRLEAGSFVSWIPEGGTDKTHVAVNPVIGVFRRVEKSPPVEYGPYWIVILGDVTDAKGDPVKDSDGNAVDELSVWLSRTVLRGEFANAAPKPGERVGVKYVGEQTAKDGKTKFHAYRVKVDRPNEQEFNWNRIGGGNMSLDDDEPVPAPPSRAEAEFIAASQNEPEDIPF